MPVFLLEIREQGNRVLEEIHAFVQGANLSLLGFVQKEWDPDLMGGPVDTLSADDAVFLFFDNVDDFSYSITSFNVKGKEILPAPPQQDPFPGMEPVLLEGLEARIISCCLKMVAPVTIKKYLHQYYYLDFAVEHVKEAQAIVIKKME